MFSPPQIGNDPHSPVCSSVWSSSEVRSASSCAPWSAGLGRGEDAEKHHGFTVEVAAAEKRERRQSFRVRDHKGIHRLLVWAEEEASVLRST